MVVYSLGLWCVMVPLAIHRRDEYAKVDIPMLPVTHGVPFTRLQILLYTVMTDSRQCIAVCIQNERTVLSGGGIVTGGRLPLLRGTVDER
jgi:protoheme IX farnesyltransferase